MKTTSPIIHILSTLLRFCAALSLAAAGWMMTPSQPVHAAATWVVTSTNGDYSSGICGNPCYLRDALHSAASGDIISFASALAGQTVTISSPLSITQNNLTLTGPASGSVTLSGQNTTQFFNIASTVRMENLILTGGSSSSAGGVIFNNGDLTLDHVTISNSTSSSTTSGGGAIYNHSGATLTITNGVFSGDTASGQGGGAIYNDAGTIGITDSTFSNNSSTMGGGIRNASGTVIVSGSTFSGNTGGAIYSNGSGALTVTNSTISGNQSNWGAGGIYSLGTLNVNFSTITGNTAGGLSSSAGIYNNSGITTITNSIIAGNLLNTTANNCGGTIGGSNNRSDDNTCGAGFYSASINLGTLGDHGGGTQTIPILTGSSAIDAAACGSIPADQRGISRPQGAGCDIGAYELQSPGVSVSSTSGLTTTEAGGTAAFTIKLNTQPAADVTIGLSSSDITEGTVSPASVTFTSANWNSARTITVTGVDDLADDGDTAYSIVTAAAASSDSNYNGIDPSNVQVTNQDDDTAGITVTPTSGLTTTEAGGTASFAVKLNTQPAADVTLALSSSDTTEGTVSPASITFTSADWDSFQTVTVTGADDLMVDGDVAYTVNLAGAVSSDPVYNGLTGSSVLVTNQDNDTPGAIITTVIHDASHNVISSAALTTLVHAGAAVTSNGSQTPTGTITFKIYANPSCSGTGTTYGPIAITGGNADMAASAAVTENGLSFKTHYNGDANFPKTDGSCISISASAYPTVLKTSPNTSPADSTTTDSGVSQLVLQFNMDVLHTSASAEHSASNPANYLLAGAGTNNAFDTISCTGGLVSDDVKITVNSANYNAGTYTVTLGINGGSRLPAGTYRLFACGTTSITAPDDSTKLNNGSDSVIQFTVSSSAGEAKTSSKKKGTVATGFAPGIRTILPGQPDGIAYTKDGMWLEIPALGVKEAVVGVPERKDGWDVSWLGEDIGYLDGTAFPTWAGNSVLTGHVTGTDGMAGPFAELGTLTWGKQIILHAFGQKYIYEVRTVDLRANPDTTKVIEKHEDLPWLTLITCRGYDEQTGSYRWRTVIRAVQIKIEVE
jgi:LPXTG-site transpeptidase (sortase) family protein